MGQRHHLPSRSIRTGVVLLAYEMTRDRGVFCSADAPPRHSSAKHRENSCSGGRHEIRIADMRSLCAGDLHRIGKHAIYSGAVDRAPSGRSDEKYASISDNHDPAHPACDGVASPGRRYETSADHGYGS